jgi:RIO kinase 1
MTDPLDVLLADGVIDEVLGRLKSGKEANISLVRRGDDVLAAKVYKDRSTRSFKNNADYKEGRKVRNSRTQRAIEGGGRFGRDAAEQAWKSAEADALYRLIDSGVRVPTPVMFYEGVLLMELVKDGDGRPAPRLIDVAIEPAAAIGVYADLVAQIIAMLCCDLIHGDLSPYNILAAADGPTIIDFPQVVSAVHSSRAEFFFLRDFDNVVRFVAGFDPALAVHRYDGRAIWRAYTSRELTRDFVPPPPPPPQARGRSDQRRDPRYDARSSPPRGDGRSSRPPQDPRWDNGPRRPDPQPAQQQQRRDGGPGRSDPQPPRSNAGPPGSSPSGRDPRGPDPRGPDPRAPGSRGPDPRAPGSRGPEPRRANGPPPRDRWSPDPRATTQPQPPHPGPSRRPVPAPGARPPPPRSDRDPAAPRGPSQPREWSSRPAGGSAPAPSRPPPPSGGHRRRPKRRW